MPCRVTSRHLFQPGHLVLRGRRGLRWVVYEEGRLHRVGADELRVVTEPVFAVMEDQRLLSVQSASRAAWSECGTGNGCRLAGPFLGCVRSLVDARGDGREESVLQESQRRPP